MYNYLASFILFSIKNSVFLLLICCFTVEAQTIRLTTEHYPPYNIDLTRTGDGLGIGGASMEIVLEVVRRSGYNYSFDLLPWKRAYGSAQEETNTGVFSTTRTEKREKLFKWVGPIANNNYVLFGRSDTAIKLNSIEDAKKHTVGAYRGSAGEAIMKASGIKPELVRSDHLNVLKLQRNRIDLWVSGNLYGPYLAKQNGVSGLKELLTVREAQMYVAFNLNTPDSIVKKLNKILEEMKVEGYVNKIYDRYR